MVLLFLLYFSWAGLVRQLGHILEWLLQKGTNKTAIILVIRWAFQIYFQRDILSRFLTPFFIVLKLVWTSSSQFLMWVGFCRNIRMCKKIHGVRNSMKGHIDRKKTVKLNQWLFGGKVLYHLNVNDISHSLYPINKYSWKFQFLPIFLNSAPPLLLQLGPALCPERGCGGALQQPGLAGQH